MAWVTFIYLFVELFQVSLQKHHAPFFKASQLEKCGKASKQKQEDSLLNRERPDIHYLFHL